MTWSASDWQRLGDQMRASRRAAGYPTKEGFADAVGISSKTYGDIEAGRLGKRASFSFDTIAQIEKELDWVTGVSRMVLDGKVVDVYSGMILKSDPPTLVPEDSFTITGRDENNDAYFAWLDERVERLEERLLKVERSLRVTNQRKEGGDDGTQASTQKNEGPDDDDLGGVTPLHPGPPSSGPTSDKLSEPNDSMKAAADRFKQRGDESPGGSR